MLKSLLIGVLSMPSFCISKLFQSGPQTDFRTRRGKFRAPKARAVRGVWGTDTLTGEGANFRTYSTTVGLSFKEIIFLVTLGNYCLKLGQVNVPLSPVLLFKIWRGHQFLAREEQKFARLSPPPFVGGMVRVHNFGSNYITGDERGKKKRQKYEWSAGKQI